MPRVVLVGCARQAQTISLIHLVRARLQTSLREAKQLVEGLMSREREVSFDFDSEEAAQAFLHEAKGFGAEGSKLFESR